MSRFRIFVIIFVTFSFMGGLATPVLAQIELEDELVMERPIPALNTIWIEEMTWIEIRDALAEGKRTAIVPTGGIEQNGPCLLYTSPSPRDATLSRMPSSA